MRVLVVEDHELLARTIGAGLRREGMAVDVVTDGGQALERLDLAPYDVVVLDRDLPTVPGDDVCRRVGERGLPARVLMLTAAATLAERVHGLDLGADDYLTKPFDFPELVARVRALGRRSGPPVPPVLRFADVELDPARRTVTRAGRPVALSPKEFAVLAHLLARPGQVVSAEELLDHVWDEAANPFTTTVKTTLGRLRAKLGEPPIITTVREGGYRAGD
ncbi:response regulator transcription factor [Micromonospora sp. DR5-3]|uniref:response regulator transcription factor n=1 Tax=unclassified Micromonospora TaxID=2617518 RepID=UPI0011DC3AC1|nr:MULTISPECIES: response regulator transcription factor [unclassified Micromonospora]MCW3820588.1 response regulator transcription factor [Micromonospora sp. DR5-3]TYC19116.1 response regulator transcription factor [Micromonospora sp. MP36]